MSEILERHSRLRFRLTHLLLVTFLVAVWFALFRFGGRVQLLLVLGTAIVVGPVIAAMGRASFRPWVELIGNVLTILSPVVFIGGLYLCWLLGTFGE
jgi:hypothetical protein